MINKLDNLLGFNQKALGLRATRQELLSGNIANADTPGFKAKDFDFSKAMQNAQSSQAIQHSALSTTAPRHIGLADFRSITSVPKQYRIPQQPSIDGNTVDMDTERMQFVDNAMRYDAGLTFISGQFRTLLSAIKEGA
ncbi:flagellar basal body rod protein FlgB [uncultured Nitrosomonas sp.]|uniref:flagellar basal body rod protein FlgB n=1 Tax=uncultured Nitrosomonas sp. TaxID=156424 RepID=UPI0026176A21|nr:flagellar basal body rod protein FlgB [uncultured Nitrosomonas sp.]